MSKILTEGLDYHDMVGQIEPTVSIDEYVAKMGKDSDVVTMAFIVNSELAGHDLVNWLERGYDYILDASVSEGELAPGKRLVFVEINRRSTVPKHIIEILKDLNTLTDIKLKDWTIKFDEEEYEPDEQILKQVLTLSPHEYRVDEENEEEINEMRQIAGLPNKNVHIDKMDIELKNFKSIAGL